MHCPLNSGTATFAFILNSSLRFNSWDPRLPILKLWPQVVSSGSVHKPASVLNALVKGAESIHRDISNEIGRAHGSRMHMLAASTRFGDNIALAKRFLQVDENKNEFNSLWAAWKLKKGLWFDRGGRSEEAALVHQTWPLCASHELSYEFRLS